MSSLVTNRQEMALLHHLTVFVGVICFDKLALGGCPFQNPFWFYEKPVVVNVFDENGEMVANKMRVMWGRMENFKCVDYFQVKRLVIPFFLPCPPCAVELQGGWRDTALSFCSGREYLFAQPRFVPLLVRVKGSVDCATTSACILLLFESTYIDDYCSDY